MIVRDLAGLKYKVVMIDGDRMLCEHDCHRVWIKSKYLVRHEAQE